jgi:hypothetical protein
MKPDNGRDERLANGFSDIPDPLHPSLDRGPLPGATAGGPSPTRRRLERRRALAFAAAAVWPLALLAGWGFRQRGSAGIGFLAAQSATWIALLALAAYLAFSRGRRGLGRPVRLIETTVIAGCLVFVLTALFWLPANAADGFAAIGPAPLLVPCVSLGLLVALPMLLVAMWPRRRAFVSGAGWRGAALGAAAGFGAVCVLTLHCSSTFGGHIALAHGAPLLVATLAGATLGVRVGRA